MTYQHKHLLAQVVTYGVTLALLVFGGERAPLAALTAVGGLTLMARLEAAEGEHIDEERTRGSIHVLACLLAVLVAIPALTK